MITMQFNEAECLVISVALKEYAESKQPGLPSVARAVLLAARCDRRLKNRKETQ